MNSKFFIEHSIFFRMWYSGFKNYDGTDIFSFWVIGADVKKNIFFINFSKINDLNSIGEFILHMIDSSLFSNLVKISYSVFKIY